MRHLWTLLYFFVGAIQATQGIKWARPDQIEKYVYLERDGHFEPHNQHPSFHNRVALDDREKKDGNVSLNLKNVTTNDTGAYECCVFINESYKSICNVTLRVDPPGQTGGDTEDGGKKDGGKLLRKSLTVAAKVMKLLVLAARGSQLFRELLALAARGSELFRELLALAARGSQLFRELLALAARGSELFRELLALAARGSELLMVVAKVMEMLEVVDRGIVLLWDLVEVVFDLLELVF